MRENIEDMEEIAKTACNLCRINCGLNVHVDNGKIVNVDKMEEHPLKMPSKQICLKPLGMIDWVYSKDRILNPLRKVGDDFKEISWDEALDYISDKLISLRKKYGAKTLVTHLGTPFIATQTEKIARRFNSLYGTPNYTSGSSFCFYAKAIGYGLTFGSYALPHYGGDSRCMVLWGTNPTESTPLATRGISYLKNTGAKLIVIDPRKTLLAKQADIHAQIRPGADGALALALLNVVIAEKLYDKEFVKDWTIGFEKLVDHVTRYTPEEVEKITWIDAGTIRTIARLYATSKPASMAPGISVIHHTNGVQTVRAIAILTAITGNVGILGGNLYAARLNQTNLITGQIEGEPIGVDYPFFSQFTRGETTATPVAESILTGKPYPIKALIVHGSNPLLTWPNSNKLNEAFKKLDLKVVIDLYMSETAKYTDIFLPGTTFLERRDLREYRPQALSLVLATQKAIEPLGNSMEDWKIWAALGRRIGYEKYFPWGDTDELFEYLLEPSGISLEQLDQKPSGIFYAKRDLKKYLEEGFNTPSKKVEIFCEQLEKHGYDPLPSYDEPAESPINRPDLAERYPLILITGARINAFYHTWLNRIPAMREYVPDPLLEINTETADELGIKDGDGVTVESLRGKIRIKAKVTDDLHPKILSMPHGWIEANANILTSDMARDPISAYPEFRSILCRVFKEK